MNKTTQSTNHVVLATIAKWDEESVSAEMAQEAIMKADRLTIAEYLDDLLVSLEHLGRGTPQLPAKTTHSLVTYLVESAPVLNQLAASLSASDKKSLRLVIKSRQGRPRKNGPLQARKKKLSTQVMLERIRQKVASYLFTLSGSLAKIDHKGVSSTAFSGIASEATSILVTMVTLLLADATADYHLDFKRPTGPPKDGSIKRRFELQAKKITINAAVIADDQHAKASGLEAGKLDAVIAKLATKTTKSGRNKSFFEIVGPNEFYRLWADMRKEPEKWECLRNRRGRDSNEKHAN